MSVPHAVTVLFGLALVYDLFALVTINGVHICDVYDFGYEDIKYIQGAELWHRMVPPAHFLLLAYLLMSIVRFWKQGVRRNAT